LFIVLFSVAKIMRDFRPIITYRRFSVVVIATEGVIDDKRPRRPLFLSLVGTYLCADSIKTIFNKHQNVSVQTSKRFAINIKTESD